MPVTIHNLNWRARLGEVVHASSEIPKPRAMALDEIAAHQNWTVPMIVREAIFALLASRKDDV